MVLMTWSLPPNFEENAQSKKQVFSAFGHGQVLLNNAEHLLGLYLAPVVPVPHYPKYHGRLDAASEWRRVWDGYIVKETDTFEYKVAAIKDAVSSYEIRIYYDEYSVIEPISNGAGTVYTNDTIDISALANGERYKIIVDGRALNGGTPTGLQDDKIRPVYLAEIDTQSYATLANFATGDTPTVKHWQALSDQQATLISQSLAPRHPFVSDENSPHYNTDVIGYAGYIQHRHNLLAYELYLESPYNEGSTIVNLKYNGVTLITFEKETVSTGHRHKETYTGTIDLTSQGLTVGNEYYIEVELELAAHGHDDWDYCKINYIYEQASVQVSIANWTEMTSFSPNQIVMGTADIAKVRDNIEWLTDRVTYRNHASHNLRDKPYYYFWRYHPWLYFFVEDEDMEPKLEYWRGEWIEVNLKNEPGEWLLYQLEDAPVRLGGMYRLTGVTCAMEVYSA